jgi:hypothetical protein
MEQLVRRQSEVQRSERAIRSENSDIVGVTTEVVGCKHGTMGRNISMRENKLSHHAVCSMVHTSDQNK